MFVTITNTVGIIYNTLLHKQNFFYSALMVILIFPFFTIINSAFMTSFAMSLHECTHTFLWVCSFWGTELTLSQGTSTVSNVLIHYVKLNHFPKWRYNLQYLRVHFALYTNRHLIFFTVIKVAIFGDCVALFNCAIIWMSLCFLKGVVNIERNWGENVFLGDETRKQCLGKLMPEANGSGWLKLGEKEEVCDEQGFEEM